MKEIYRDSDDVVRLEITDSNGFVDATGAVTVEITDPNDEDFEPVTGTAVKVATGRYEFDVPFSVTDNDRILHVEWTYTLASVERTVKHTVHIVTPYVSLAEMLSMFADSENNVPYTVERLKEMERKVRYVINAVTGQEFGKHIGSYRVYGEGGNQLELPYPLLETTGVSFGGATYNPTSYLIKGSGWYLARAWNAPLSIKQAPPEDLLDGWVGVNGVITVPSSSYYTRFGEDVEYVITGTWGYDEVPAAVNEAARILLNDYACNEATWRDRYIETIRSGDWNFQFNPATFHGTGNVIADQLLNSYTQTGMRVI